MCNTGHETITAAAKCLAIIYPNPPFLFLLQINSIRRMFLQLTCLSESDVEVVSHRSAGVRGDWTVALLPCPIDQGLWPRRQVLLGGF